jgi:hypothetical protein
MPPEPPSPVAIDEVVAGAAGFVSHRVGKEAVELTVDVPRDLPRVAGIRAELHSVVLNLLVNALDAVEGTAMKKVSVRAARSAGSVVLVVEDTGCGMDEATAARAFDIFFTTKGPDRGTGLGLSMVHRIVTDCGGAIELDSAVGRGTTVTVRLPAVKEGSSGGA